MWDKLKSVWDKLVGVFAFRPIAARTIGPKPEWITFDTKANPKWRLTGFAYQDEKQSGGNHNIYVTVVDENGAPESGITVWQKWPDAAPNEAQQATLGGTTNFGIYGGAFFPDRGEHGAYWCYVEDESVSDVVRGIGLPVNRHVNYILTFQRIGVVVPPPVTPPSDTSHYVTEMELPELVKQIIKDQWDK